MMQSRLDSSRGMVTLDLYTVGRFYPDTCTCDLYPGSIQQRGELSGVPVMVPFGGSWEAQSGHSPNVEGFVSEEWGNVSRGARWGLHLPVEPGDVALVAYLGGGSSDPVVIGFLWHRGNFPVPWAANRILSQENDYTDQLADDEDLMSGRFDVLLPSGGWLRCGQKSSWTIATAPVDRPKAFFTMHSTGDIRLKARAAEDYTIHAEFSPADEYGRIVIGDLETGSLIEFKEGNITIKAQKSLILQAEEIEGDVRPQNVTTAMDTLTTTPSAAISDQELPGLVSQAAGQQTLQAAAGAVPPPGGVVVTTTVPTDDAIAKVIDREPPIEAIMTNLCSNPAIDGALRGRIQDVLQDPGALVERAKAALSETLPNDLAIGDRLTSLLGAQVLNGDLTSLTSNLDLTSLPMVQELGLNSWDVGGLQEMISGGGFQGLTRIFDGALGDKEILDTALRFVGDRVMEGNTPGAARSLLQGALSGAGLEERVNGLISRSNAIPLATPEGIQEIAAQRLGRHVMRGSDSLGGSMNLFSGLEETLGSVPQLGEIQRVAGQIEGFAGNPHQLVRNPLENADIQQLAQLPPEIRDVISRVPQDLIGRLPQIARGSLGDLRGPVLNSNNPLAEEPNGCQVGSEFEEQLTSMLPAWDDLEREAGAVIQAAPQMIKDLVGNLGENLLGGLQSAIPEDFRGMLENPQAILDKVDPAMIQSCFGGLTSANTGTFDMRVLKRAVFQTMPQPSAVVQDLGGDRAVHEDTVDLPIERVLEYGPINMPSWWADQEGG